MLYLLDYEIIDQSGMKAAERCYPIRKNTVEEAKNHARYCLEKLFGAVKIIRANLTCNGALVCSLI